MTRPSFVIVVVQLISVGIATAIVLLRSPRLLRLPAFARATAGASTTPLLIGGYTVLAALVWPHAGRLLYALPLAVSAAVIWRQRATLGWAVRKIILNWSANRTNWPVVAVRVGATGACVWVLVILAGNSLEPIIGHDALIYFNEAKAFSAVRATSAIPGFRGAPGEVIATHPHLFLHQAYLANAFITGSSSLEPPDDLAPRIASQATVAFLLLGVLALGGVVRSPGLASLGLLLTLTVALLGYITLQDSRDGVRILSLVAFTLSLVPFVDRARRPRSVEYALPALMAAFTVYAHTINLLFLAIVGMALMAVAAMNRIGPARILTLGLAVGAGALLPATHYLRMWWDTGSVLGYGMYYRFYQGTPLWQAFLSEGDWGRPSPGLAGALWYYAQLYGLFLTAGAAAAALLILLDGRLRRVRLVAAVYLLGLVLPLAGVLESGGVNIQQAMLANLRYPLAIYPFAGVALAVTLWVSLPRFLDGGSRAARRVRGGILVGVAVLAAVGAARSLGRWEHRTFAKAYVDENYLQLRAVLEQHLRPGEAWATDLYAAAYYAPQQPVFLFSEQGSPLFRSDNPALVRVLLRDNRVRVVALRNNIDTWWRGTAFLAVLEKDADLLNFGFWKVYLLRPPA